MELLLMNMVFFGEYLVSFTAPGRIILPKKIRELIKGDEFVISRSFDTCLAGYDYRDWEVRTSELLKVPLFDQENLRKRRFVFSSAVLVDIDDQGRFVIPKLMLEFSGLGSKALIAGVGDHFEIWHPDKWREQSKEFGL